ncbi:MAG TPA: hypothetical protein PLQ81_08010, partial [bacterium]|nr:hypothetical protein [bacterium]
MKYKIKLFISFLVFLFIFHFRVLAAPSSLSNCYVKSADAAIGSNVQYATIGDAFELIADTNFPLWTGIPDNFLCAVVKSSNLNDTIYLRLYQENSDSKTYKTTFSLVSIDKSNGQLKQVGINSNSGETIYFSYNGIVYDSLVVAISKPPAFVNALNFYGNSEYANIITDSGVPLETICYIEANCVDGSEYSIDSLPVIVENSYNDAFTLYLNETGKHMGKFRGQIQLSNSTIPQYGFIKVLAQGNTVQIRETISNNRAVVSYRQPSEPNIFYGIKFTTNITGNILKTDSLVLESNVFIKLSGNDPNPNIVDLVRVIIKNSRTGDTIVKVLYENSQGAYTGSFYLTAYTNGTLGYLGGLAGDVIVISNYSYSVFDTN